MKPQTHLLRSGLGLVVALASSALLQGFAAEPAQAAGNPNVLPSLLCEFNEGKVVATISVEGLVLTKYDSRPVAYQFVSANVANPAMQTYMFQTGSRKSKIDITISKDPNASGSDGVTTMEYEYSAQFPEGSGVCTGFPKGFVPRSVRNVAPDDLLNIRLQASSTASIVASVSNNSRIFVGNTVKASKTTKSTWAKVAVPVYPANEDGPIKTVVGYANISFLTTQPEAKL